MKFTEKIKSLLKSGWRLNWKLQFEFPFCEEKISILSVYHMNEEELKRYIF